MRPDLRLRLREIRKSLSTPKQGVAGVPAPTVHPLGTPSAPEKGEQNQYVTPVTPCNTLGNRGGIRRYNSPGVSAGIAYVVADSGVESEVWFAHFEERAAIREYEGGFERAEAERLALTETIMALGPKPSLH